LVVCGDLTESGAVHNNADILAACDGTTLSEGLRASTSGLDSGVVTKTRFGKEGCASGSRHRDWLTDPVMASNLTAPSCLVAENVTEGGVVDGSVEIPSRCATTTPESNLRASTSDVVSGTATEPSNAFGCASESRLSEWAVDPSDCQHEWQQSQTLFLMELRFRKLSP